MLAEQLRKAWRAREAAAGPYDETLCFKADGLVLGAGTVLAAAREDKDATVETSETSRLEALLSVAYGRPATRRALGHIRSATARWRAGDEARARLHIALSGLGRLNLPTYAARRLFIADGLMRIGVPPDAIVGALEVHPTLVETALKYSPNQPRVPAGHGRPSGRWTTSGSGGAVASKPTQPTQHRGQALRVAPKVPVATARPSTRPSAAPGRKPSAQATSSRVNALTASRARLGSAAVVAAGAGRLGAGLDLGALTDAALGRLAQFLAGAAASEAFAVSIAAGGAVAGLGVLFIPSTGPKGQWVRVGGKADVSYFRNPDERVVTFRFTAPDGTRQTLSTTPDRNGDYRDPHGRLIARLVKTAMKVGIVVSTTELVDNGDERPRLCPAPVKDNGGELGTIFEDYAKALFNPGNPTPHGMAYAFFNPLTKKWVKIDDCQQKSGHLLEYKGPNYGIHLRLKDYVWFQMKKKMIEQALNQANARGDRPLTWYFADRDVARTMKAIFKKNDTLKYVDVEWLPWPGGPK